VLAFAGGPLTAENAALFAGDLFVAKLDSDGRHLWSHRIGAESFEEYGTVIASDASSNVFIASGVNESVDLLGNIITATAEDAIFLAKLDAQGGYVWRQVVGGGGGGATSPGIR